MKSILLAIALVLIVVLVAMFFVGCAKVVDTTSVVVKATVESTEFEDSWLQPVYNPAIKMTQLIPHDAEYKVTVVYAGLYKTFDNEALYKMYKDKWGSEIEVYLVTKYYDDGTTKSHLSLTEE